MKNVNMFPVLAGSLCISEKNAVICTVSKKGAISLHSYKLKNKLIPHHKVWFLRGIEFLFFASFYFFWALDKSFNLLKISNNLKKSTNNKKNIYDNNESNVNKSGKNKESISDKSGKNKENILDKSGKNKENNSEKFEKNQDNNLKTASLKVKTALEKPYVVIAVLLVSAFLLTLFFGYLSTHIGFWIFSENTSLFVKKLCVALNKCLILYLILIALYLFPAVKNFYKFNTAGNIVLNKENDKLKNHRATNFLNFVFFSLLLSYLMISLIGLNISPWLKPLANFAIMLVCFSVSFEFLNLLDAKWIKLKKLILVTSWLVNSKPSPTEMQATRATFYEGDLMTENKNRLISDNQTTEQIALSYVYPEIKEKLLSAKITDNDEADWLIASYLNVPKLEIKFINSITKQQYKDLQKILSRRLKGEPISKIFGFTDFYGLKIKINKNVFSPRQETEILAENAIKIANTKKFNVLELCTGSGAVAIAIAKNTNANVFACDISPQALEIAKENAITNDAKIEFKQSDLFQNYKKKTFFDLVVSNPPYIKTEDINTLQTEVKKFDPVIALDGGSDGLYFYKKIIAEAPKFLSEKGKILFEVGYDQSAKVKKLLTDNFINIKIVKDFNRINRIIMAEKKPKEPKKRKFLKNKEKVEK